MIKSFCLFFLIILQVEAYAQIDSIVGAKFDSLKNIGKSVITQSNESDKDYRAVADSSTIITRHFELRKVEALKKRADLQYKEPPTIAESLWDRLMNWIKEFFSGLVETSIRTNWGRVILYSVALVILVFLVMMLLKVDAFKLFYSAKSKSINYAVLEENIHEMDFDKLIQDAMKEGDYRRGVRLTFLYALKILSDNNYIHWQSGKTNHDYVKELSKAELKMGFNELNFYFEYAWYGNFSITHDMFKKVQHVFGEWKNNVR